MNLHTVLAALLLTPTLVSAQTRPGRPTRGHRLVATG